VIGTKLLPPKAGPSGVLEQVLGLEIWDLGLGTFFKE